MRILTRCLATLATVLIPAIAAASPLVCPPEMGGANDYDRQYWLSPATACVWGTGFLNNSSHDDFLDGTGIEDGINSSAILGGFSSGAAAGWQNLSYLFDDDSELDPNWIIASFDPAREYLVGIKGGNQSPAWTVFLITASSGTWGTIPVGAWGHGVLYSRPATGSVTYSELEPVPVPEPASLVLLGSGLALVGHRIRRSGSRIGGRTDK